jgi:hypothetical protein
MRGGAIVVLLWAAQTYAQTAVDPARLPTLLRNFEPRPGDAPLACEVTPVAPALNFAFRFQAGYVFHLPAAQYSADTRGWSVLTKITPKDGSRQPVYLWARSRPADVSAAESKIDIRGFYFLGEGRYAVESSLRDDRNRICRKHWQIAVKRARGPDAVASALPPSTVRDFSALTWLDVRPPDDAAPLRLCVLLNAAAFSARRTAMRAADRLVLLGVLTALLERVPTTSVRLVVFSLEQQREVFRRDDFNLAALDKVAEALDALQLSAVDVHVLRKPLGHVDFLASLVNGELRASVPAGTVIFMGPTSRYGNRLPDLALDKPSAAAPRFFYLQYQGPRRLAVSMSILPDASSSDAREPGAGPMSPDSTPASRPSTGNGSPPANGGGGMCAFGKPA